MGLAYFFVLGSQVRDLATRVRALSGSVIQLGYCFDLSRRWFRSRASALSVAHFRHCQRSGRQASPEPMRLAARLSLAEATPRLPHTEQRASPDPTYPANQLRHPALCFRGGRTRVQRRGLEIEVAHPDYRSNPLRHHRLLQAGGTLTNSRPCQKLLLPKKQSIAPRRLGAAQFSALMDAHWKKFDALSAPKKLTCITRPSWITKEVKSPVYPMDHVPSRTATAI